MLVTSSHIDLHPVDIKAKLLQWNTFCISCIRICVLFQLHSTACLPTVCIFPPRLLALLERLHTSHNLQCNCRWSNAQQIVAVRLRCPYCLLPLPEHLHIHSIYSSMTTVAVLIVSFIYMSNHMHHAPGQALPYGGCHDP